MGSANHSPSSDNAAMATADEMFSKRGCCCFFVPWPNKAWERIMPPASERTDGVCPAASRRWWCRGWKAILKVREWSELVAGPRWKTFIRRFRRRPRNGGGGKPGGRFGYDPMSYARNFDEGQGSDSDGDTVRRGFSARYATPPALAKSSMDLGGLNDAPLLVGYAH
ncbi:uncharacterized protein LOC108953411 [Musa acuminata AAA Group]|uniref:(wild Malaysian banana) hypothetical protein n=1 Tax=Musa acuminata subsp. malaccensis TaxID=214687 RepID=A0A804JSJ2_MUSAM|nr:PREDICTED: uncharacterized protein LOC103990540 [Musa acuminata subsp. malaccensis]CAG1855719.1 unnamed protein product [Musa acuminata subsp. malaccensis]